MGQRQLLLLVLGIVIVGLAVVVGIQAFSENQKKANLDAMVNDGVRIASDLQAWSLKPKAFGGPEPGAGSGAPWTTASFDDLGYDTSDDRNGTCAANEYGNLNGCYTLALGVINGKSLDATAATTGADATAASGNYIKITVSGTTPAAILTETSATGPIATPTP